MLTAEQLQWALNDLPNVNEVKGDYYRVAVREYRTAMEHTPGAVPVKESVRFFEFRKTGHQWALESVPQF